MGQHDKKMERQLFAASSQTLSYWWGQCICQLFCSQAHFFAFENLIIAKYWIVNSNCVLLGACGQGRDPWCHSRGGGEQNEGCKCLQDNKNPGDTWHYEDCGSISHHTKHLWCKSGSCKRRCSCITSVVQWVFVLRWIACEHQWVIDLVCLYVVR